MSEAVMAKDSDRLPWLETRRAAPARGKARTFAAGVVAAVTVASAASLILLRQPVVEAPHQTRPVAQVDLPEPIIQEPKVAEIVPSPRPTRSSAIATKVPRKAVRRSTGARMATRRVLKAPVERLAYREVVLQQSVTAPMATPVPYDPPLVRPTVNPAAVLRRGKSVQLGAYLTQRQAEIAWQRAIRDYTWLVTFPKDISLVQLGPRKLRFYRLQLGTPSKRHALQLCSNLKSTGRNCTVA